jgi:hypothetical protein
MKTIAGTSKTKTIVLVPDLQVPFHDRKGVAALAKFIEEYKPDEVACVGDLIDMPQISQWTKGTAGEHTRDLHKHRNEAVEVIEMLRINHISRANHEDRLWKSLSSRLPGLLDLPELRIETFLRLDEMNVQYHHGPYELAHNWYLMHGDESTQSSKAGMTGANLSQRVGASVAIGHTHKLGLIPTTHMLGGKIRRTDWGFEVGCILDFNSKGFKYMKGMANWTPGFGLLKVDGKAVTPVPVPIIGRSFTVEGTTYQW